jgi:hypothetical protein
VLRTRSPSTRHFWPPSRRRLTSPITLALASASAAQTGHTRWSFKRWVTTGIWRSVHGMRDDFGMSSRNSEAYHRVGTAANFFFTEGTGLRLL